MDRLHYVYIASLLIQWLEEEVIAVRESIWYLSVHGRQLGSP